jgi:hypothetical protein
MAKYEVIYLIIKKIDKRHLAAGVAATGRSGKTLLIFP